VKTLVGPSGVYRILRTLGKGPRTTVFEGVCEDSSRKVRVKQWATLGALERSAAHVHLAHYAKHFRTWEVLWDFDQPTIVDDFIEGATLESLLTLHGPPLLPDALLLLWAISIQLDTLHRHGILHGNVKPSNVLVANTQLLTLVDAGSVILPEHPPYYSTFSADEYSWCAPEVLLQGVRSVASDIYAFTITAFSLINGGVPFLQHKDSSLLLADCIQGKLYFSPDTVVGSDRNLALLFRTLLHPERAKRPATSYEVYEVLCKSFGKEPQAKPRERQRVVTPQARTFASTQRHESNGETRAPRATTGLWLTPLCILFGSILLLMAWCTDWFTPPSTSSPFSLSKVNEGILIETSGERAKEWSVASDNYVLNVVSNCSQKSGYSEGRTSFDEKKSEEKIPIKHVSEEDLLYALREVYKRPLKLPEALPNCVPSLSSIGKEYLARVASIERSDISITLFKALLSGSPSPTRAKALEGLSLYKDSKDPALKRKAAYALVIAREAEEEKHVRDHIGSLAPPL
jgi:serine/threonine protein kinase